MVVTVAVPKYMNKFKRK